MRIPILVRWHHLYIEMGYSRVCGVFYECFREKLMPLNDTWLNFSHGRSFCQNSRNSKRCTIICHGWDPLIYIVVVTSETGFGDNLLFMKFGLQIVRLQSHIKVWRKMSVLAVDATFWKGNALTLLKFCGSLLIKVKLSEKVYLHRMWQALGLTRDMLHEY